MCIRDRPNAQGLTMEKIADAIIAVCGPVSYTHLYNHEEETKQAFHAQTEGSIYDEHLWY